MNKVIDLRSDTVTRPSEAMRRAMANAEVGDDVFGDDPTVRQLEERVAELTGQDAGLYLPSGTQSNLVALLTHCRRGDEYLVGQTAHTYKYEGGGAAALGGIQPQPIDFEADGTLEIDKLRAAVKPYDPHFAETALLCLENTVHGKVLPMEYLPRALAVAHEFYLSTHLDGARVFNAAVKLGIPVRDITAEFDSASLCFSKGLGAPVGSVLVGCHDYIRGARRWRKVTGGGMRQAGVIAAAALFALEHNIERLAEDHDNAARLAEGLANISGIELAEAPQTNMVFLRAGIAPEVLAERLEAEGVRILPGKVIRLVTHLDVSREDIDAAIAAFAKAMKA